MEKFGVENLKLIIALPIEIGNVSMKIYDSADKSWKRFFSLIETLDEAVDLLKVNWKLIKDEYLDLSEIEKAEIMQTIKQKFDIADDILEEIIEDSFTALFDMESSIKKMINVARKIKERKKLA